MEQLTTANVSWRGHNCHERKGLATLSRARFGSVSLWPHVLMKLLGSRAQDEPAWQELENFPRWCPTTSRCRCHCHKHTVLLLRSIRGFLLGAGVVRSFAAERLIAVEWTLRINFFGARLLSLRCFDFEARQIFFEHCDLFWCAPSQHRHRPTYISAQTPWAAPSGSIWSDLRALAQALARCNRRDPEERRTVGSAMVSEVGRPSRVRCCRSFCWWRRCCWIESSSWNKRLLGLQNYAIEAIKLTLFWSTRMLGILNWWEASCFAALV